MKYLLLIFMIMTCLRPFCYERMTNLTKAVVMLLVNGDNEQKTISGNVFLSSWSDSSHYYLNVQFCEENSGSSGGNGRISVKYLTSERNPFFKATKCTSGPDQGNRIKIPPSFCIRQCGEDIFTTMLTAGGNKWGIVCKKVVQSLSKSCICH